MSNFFSYNQDLFPFTKYKLNFRKNFENDRGEIIRACDSETEEVKSGNYF